MTARKDTIFERFLKPIAQVFINPKDLERLYQSIDWQAASDRLSDPSLIYPDYYRNQNFHSIEGGYLNISAALSYDAVTQYALPPNETWVRQSLIDSIQSKPRRILDLGCGTGSTTLMLKRAFPTAEVIGLDLSPPMLTVAEYKAHGAGLDISWRHGRAEQTRFPSASFDLITATLLFHETPPAVSRAILRESHRLLTPGGEMVVLDGNQKVLREVEWLTQIFEEPYIQDYAADSTDAWMGAAGFGAVQTEEIWWLHQLSRGVKPLSNQESPLGMDAIWDGGDRAWAVGTSG